jgi:methylated-DNA-[protein]-cysteine S-methyltransferase
LEGNMAHFPDLKKNIRENRSLTLFQKKVLLAVLYIPRGETRTYAWVAGRIKSPRSCRAVGNTLSKNPYAPRVPCHRVVASDGSIGGYSGGIARKKTLLEKEGAWPLPLKTVPGGRTKHRCPKKMIGYRENER